MDNNTFIAEKGTIKNKELIKQIREFVFSNFQNQIKNRETFHKYISNMPNSFKKMVNEIKHSNEITSKICEQFKYNNCDIRFLDNIDELYISHYNIDNGGDQGLFDKHYDGVLKFIKTGTIIRALVYVNSQDNYVVHFLDSKKDIHFKTNEFALLDFNREYHYVDGTYDKNIKIEEDRIILKLHYLVCPNCSELYINMLSAINKLISFDITRTAMNYSKNPKTITQKIIGFFCNLFRILNNISVYLSLLLGLLLILIICVLIYIVFKFLLNFSKNKRIHKK
jgi:hypothetical protein